jgi:hypothetical protein
MTSGELLHGDANRPGGLSAADYWIMTPEVTGEASIVLERTCERSMAELEPFREFRAKRIRELELRRGRDK